MDLYGSKIHVEQNTKQASMEEAFPSFGEVSLTQMLESDAVGTSQRTLPAPSRELPARSVHKPTLPALPSTTNKHPVVPAAPSSVTFRPEKRDTTSTQEHFKNQPVTVSQAKKIHNSQNNPTDLNLHSQRLDKSNISSQHSLSFDIPLSQIISHQTSQKRKFQNPSQSFRSLATNKPNSESRYATMQGSQILRSQNANRENANLISSSFKTGNISLFGEPKTKGYNINSEVRNMSANSQMQRQRNMSANSQMQTQRNMSANLQMQTQRNMSANSQMQTQRNVPANSQMQKQRNMPATSDQRKKGAPTVRGVQLRSVDEIPQRFREIFTFPYFNILQSLLFEEILHTDKSVIASAPTGSGKTVIFELALVRLLTKLENNGSLGKVVYMAPMKALCTERFQDWNSKFGSLGINCLEVTGDSDMDDLSEISAANLICTTPGFWCITYY